MGNDAARAGAGDLSGATAMRFGLFFQAPDATGQMVRSGLDAAAGRGRANDAPIRRRGHAEARVS
ncbi:MAG: hypothetical protein DMD99_09585 [Candidatus Rokuibacteriota bacterium]|nr:MAG: hypothetical protein DMD99_09585 [Candidatus Rokubacteria bacterium]